MAADDQRRAERARQSEVPINGFLALRRSLDALRKQVALENTRAAALKRQRSVAPLHGVDDLEEFAAGIAQRWPLPHDLKRVAERRSKFTVIEGGAD
jgi:hypothetical protein